MPEDAILPLIAFTLTCGLVLLGYLLLTGRLSRLDLRVGSLVEQRAASARGTAPANPIARWASATLPKVATPLVPKKEEERTALQNRLLHAGLYGRQAMYMYLGIKVFLILGPLAVIVPLMPLGLFSPTRALLAALTLGLVGLIGPSFWLDRRKAARQRAFRRALPDALDVLVICLEGGLSLPGALRRVASELRTAHPQLARELNIVQREVQLGHTPGEALLSFAERADLEELRSLASVISQAEKYGSSLVKALRVHAETLRQKRLHYAEELAQKAAVKVLFPTLLLIFPGILLVVLGPAVIKIGEMLLRMKR